jgi:hypothetical protein
MKELLASQLERLLSTKPEAGIMASSQLLLFAYDIVIEFTTYNSNGTVYSTEASATIDGTWDCDLQGTGQTSGAYDFHWNILSGSGSTCDVELDPHSPAVFAVY